MRRWLAVLVIAGCGGSAPNMPAPDGGGDPYGGAARLDVPVPSSGRVYVRLATPALVTPAGDPASAADWDLAFEGYGLFTNSGPSGGGQGAAFGPLDLAAFAGSAAPDVPFLQADRAGGAFLDWYAYDGVAHLLYSRFHVYGVQSGGRLWKLQLLGYYGVQNGAPTSAIYQVRYAELGATVGATQTLTIDATAGGLAAPASAPSACVDLASGAIVPLTAAQAGAASTWDLCFRRDAISVNGEVGGPRGVGAVDLQAAASAGETLAALMAATADSEQPRFDAATAAAFAGASFRGDHVVSAFESGGWIDVRRNPVAGAWLVVDASGQHQFLVSFDAFTGATTSSPGTVVMHIKPVTG